MAWTRWTDEQLLDALRATAAENDGRVNRQIYDDHLRQHGGANTMPSRGAQLARFGSWRAAREAAGIQNRSAPYVRWSDEQLLNALRAAAAEVDGPLTKRAYDALRLRSGTRRPDSGGCIKRFGSWAAACSAAGLSENAPARPPRTTPELVEDLLGAGAALGPSPRLEDYNRWAIAQRDLGVPRADGRTIGRRFGSWHHALEAAGITDDREATEALHLEQMRCALAAATLEVDGPLTRSAYDGWVRRRRAVDEHHSSGEVVRRAHGSWGQALAAAGVATNHDEGLRGRVLEALRVAAHEIGEPMPYRTYKKWQARNPSYPSESIALRLFGSWSHALVAAGLVPGRRGRSALPGPGERDLADLRDAANDKGQPLSYRSYTTWALEHDRKPVSRDAWAKVYGTWVAACRAAGVESRRTGRPRTTGR